MTHPTSLTLADIGLCAHLARLQLDEAASQAALQELSNTLAAAQAVLAVPTEGIAPLTRPEPLGQEAALRLHPDVPLSDIDRERLMQNAPAAQDGLFLVPRVIE